MKPGQWVTPTDGRTAHSVWTVRHGRVLSWCIDVHRSIGSLRKRVGGDLVCRTCWDAMGQRWAA